MECVVRSWTRRNGALPSRAMFARCDRVVLACVAAACLLVAAAESFAGIEAGLLHLAPALVLLVPLLAGRYLGADAIAAIAAIDRPVRRAPVVVAPRLDRAPLVVAARGTGLLARRLAERGPPALPLHV